MVSLPPELGTIDAVWRVRQAIDELPPDEATVVRMQHLDGMTHSEISEKLGIAAGNGEVEITPRPPKARGTRWAISGVGPMTDSPTNEEREALIAGDRAGALEPDEAAELALLADLLADPSTWAEPSAGLEDTVVARSRGCRAGHEHRR